MAPPNELFKVFLAFQTQKMQLEYAINNEQVTFEQYVGYLNKSLAHDKVLLKYYEDYSKANHANEKHRKKFTNQMQYVKLRIQ
mmetsp:Transcript_33582/g.38605  ORF Transcript_33582/g.38605 Transcript_33582/m.38605 type:complete len:83 (+) Transcript_33582:646-894(+)